MRQALGDLGVDLPGPGPGEIGGLGYRDQQARFFGIDPSIGGRLDAEFLEELLGVHGGISGELARLSCLPRLASDHLGLFAGQLEEFGERLEGPILDLVHLPIPKGVAAAKQEDIRPAKVLSVLIT
jgi:hypothetical protein